MPLKLISPIYKTFTLDRTDAKYGTDGESTSVTVKQAAQYEHERRQDLFSRLERRYNELQPEEMTLVQNISMEELKRKESYLTIVECNILDVSGNLMFPSRKGRSGLPELDMSEQQFNTAWGKLPPDVASEMHEKVLEVNLMWGGASGEE